MSETMKAGDASVVVERTVEAPRERVFEAWTRCEHARHWFGPAGHTVPECTMDARPGGRYRVCMRSPDGLDCWEDGVFRELAAPERLVTDYVVTFGDSEPVRLATEVTFEALSRERTRIVVRQHYLAESFTEGAEEGTRQTLERLESYLEAASAPPPDAGHSLEIVRRLDAPRALVWRAWTDGDLVRRWFCPQECTVLDAEAEVRVGGRYRETMRCGNTDYTVGGAYREVVEGERLVFTHQWDEPGAPETLVTVTLEDESGHGGAPGTRLTFRQIGLASPESAESHETGWISAFENLAAVLDESA